MHRANPEKILDIAATSSANSQSSAPVSVFQNCETDTANIQTEMASALEAVKGDFRDIQSG